ncbi:unnamed protein product [Camellia sinensis]
MALAMKHLIFFAIAILVVSQATEAKKLKQTQVEFYMHDTVGGPNPSAVRVAGRSNFTSSNPIAAMFGSIYMMDNPLTITPALNSTVMGRAQGIYGMSSQHDELSLLMTLTYNFITGPYNGSSFSVIGRNPIANEVREMPVVGGTGMFRLARGYCLAKTYSTNQMDAIVGYNFPLAQAPRGTMVFNSNGDNKKAFHEMNKMASCDNKCDRDKETVPSSTQSNNIELEEKEIDESSWPNFADEDYIVFSFKEDGAIHVVQDGKPKVSNHVDSMTRSSTRPINHKLRYGSEYAEKAYNSGSSSTRSHGHDHMLNEEYGRYIYPTNESPSISYNKKGKGKWNMNLEMDNTLHKGVWRGDGKNDIIEEEEEEEKEEEIPKESKMVLSTTTTQSSESSTDQSDGSSSSFAFPVLCSEGMGSPVRMPKPDSLHFRKHHKALAARLYCCRF